MKYDEEYSYRDIDCELREVYKNVDKIVAYVNNEFKGDLYLNSNIWQPCYEALVGILRLYDLKFIGSDKVTENEKIVNVNDYINNQLKKMNITQDISDDLVQGYFLSITGLNASAIMTSPDEKRKYLYKYVLDSMENHNEITHEQRLNYDKEYLKLEHRETDFNDTKENPDIEMGTIIKYGNYVCEVDDYNQDNPNESIVFIYSSQEDLDKGEYLEQVSLLNKNIKDNIQEYMKKNYYIKPVTRLDLLQEIQEQISYDLFVYSKNYLMNTPKNGYEQEWKRVKDKYDLIQQMVMEEKKRTIKKKKEDLER